MAHRIGPGPVFAFECVAAARRWQFYAGRALFVLLLMIGLSLIWAPAGQIFQNSRGLNAAALIVQAGLTGTRVGGAEISERNANYIVANPGATARDVLRLIDLIKSRVQDRFHVELELELSVW